MVSRRTPEVRCPACHTRLWYPQRFCAACGRFLGELAPAGNIPPGPLADRPPLGCPRCGYPAHPSATFCANCGLQLVARPWLVPAKPKKPKKNYPWLPYVMFPLLMVLQIGLVVMLFLISRGPLSISRMIFVGGIAMTGVANVFGCINCIHLLLKTRATNRRRAAFRASQNRT